MLQLRCKAASWEFAAQLHFIEARCSDGFVVICIQTQSFGAVALWMESSNNMHFLVETLQVVLADHVVWTCLLGFCELVLSVQHT